jgi:hypothetical protein
MLGLRVSANGEAERGLAILMTAAEWKTRRAELEKLGGVPIDIRK